MSVPECSSANWYSVWITAMIANYWIHFSFSVSIACYSCHPVCLFSAPALGISVSVNSFVAHLRISCHRKSSPALGSAASWSNHATMTHSSRFSYFVNLSLFVRQSICSWVQGMTNALHHHHPHPHLHHRHLYHRHHRHWKYLRDGKMHSFNENKDHLVDCISTHPIWHRYHRNSISGLSLYPGCGSPRSRVYPVDHAPDGT